MRIFDCDVAYGRGACSLPREIVTADDLAAELAHCEIQQALVWHRDAYERSFDVGNRRLDELLRLPNLHPAITFVPPCTREMPSVEEFLTAMRSKDIRAVRAFPSRHCYCLDRVSCGELLECFISYSVPVLVPLSEFSGGWQGVYALLRDFPRLTLILTETGCWGQDRYFRPLMKTYPRFHITTSRLETAGQIKDLVDFVGPARVLFGSGLPRNYPGGYIMMLARADISEEAKEHIAHRNIERLLKEVAW